MLLPEYLCTSRLTFMKVYDYIITFDDEVHHLRLVLSSRFWVQWFRSWPIFASPRGGRSRYCIWCVAICHLCYWLQIPTVSPSSYDCLHDWKCCRGITTCLAVECEVLSPECVVRCLTCQTAMSDILPDKLMSVPYKPPRLTNISFIYRAWGNHIDGCGM